MRHGGLKYFMHIQTTFYNVPLILSKFNILSISLKISICSLATLGFFQLLNHQQVRLNYKQRYFEISKKNIFIRFYINESL